MTRGGWGFEVMGPAGGNGLGIELLKQYDSHGRKVSDSGPDQSGPYARPMIVTKRAATASAAATE
jgi:hypothetical protein